MGVIASGPHGVYRVLLQCDDGGREYFLSDDPVRIDYITKT